MSKPLCVLTLNSLAVAAYHALWDSGSLPPYLPSLKMSDQPFELTSFALSLLLVGSSGGGGGIPDLVGFQLPTGISY